MKATIDIPDDLYRHTKATAALLGRPLKDLVVEALREKLATLTPQEPPTWRRLFGAASRDAVEEVDALIAADLGTVDPETWR